MNGATFGGPTRLTQREARALAAELNAQIARTSDTVAVVRLRGEMIEFDLAEPRAGRTPHRICWSTRTRDEVLAHWRGYIGEARS